MAKEPRKLIANNKKARHDYFIEDTYEAGICLHGTEVKSLRMGKCSVKESFIRIEDGEVFIYNMHISHYENGNIYNKESLSGRTYGSVTPTAKQWITVKLDLNKLSWSEGFDKSSLKKICFG